MAKKLSGASIITLICVTLSGCEHPVGVAANCNDFEVELHTPYTGPDGMVYPTSIDRMTPYEFVIGIGDTTESRTRYHGASVIHPDGSTHPVTIVDFEGMGDRDKLREFCQANGLGVIVPAR